MPLHRTGPVLLVTALIVGGLAFAYPARATVYVYHCVLNPRQESPPVASSAFGGGQITIDTNANTLAYRVSFTGLAGAETAAQIHGAAGSGANAGALVTLPAGNPKVGVWHYPEAQEASILGGLTYVNILTAFAPGGELRGQIVPLNALIDGAQEISLPATAATGWATFTIDTTANALNYYVSYENLSSAETAAHIHGPGLHGTNAGVLVALPAGTPKAGTWNYPQANEAAILAGRTYVNVHSTGFPGGEIRGQIVPVVVPIDAQQEIASPLAAGAAGVGLIAIDTLANQMSYDVRIGGLTSGETAAHLHGYAAAGANAGVLAALASGARKIGVWTYPATDDSSVLGGKTYMNVHTSNNPGGEIRGQILMGQPLIVPDPYISIGDRSVAEGDNGTRSLVVYASLSVPALSPVTVNYATADSTATLADNDYQPASGTLTFPPGSTSQPISVTLNGDLVPEGDETFKIDLSSPVGAAIADAQAVGTIADDDRAALICTDLWVANGNVLAMVAAGGTIYIGGNFTQVGPATGSAVPLDAATGLPLGLPLVAGTVNAVAPDGSGGWCVGGSFTHVGGIPRSNLARILADHTLSAWDPGANGLVNSLAVSGGTVYVGGNFTSIAGQARNWIAALDATTGLATGWNPNANGTVLALAVSGGTVYAGGAFTSIGGQARNRIAALDASSGLATAWNPNASSTVRALAVSGGTVYAGGDFTTIGGQPRNRIAALDGTSGLAAAWDPNANIAVRAMVVSGGTVYAGGSFTTIGGQARSRIAALDGASGLATAWDPNASTIVRALAVSGGTVYAGGDFISIGGQARNQIAALDAASGLATAWDPNANSAVNALAVSAGTVYAGGSFTSVGGQARNRIAALDAASGLATGWNPNSSSSVSALAVSGGTVYAGGSFTSIGGQARTNLAALDGASGLATGWNPNANNFVNALAVAGGTLYAGGTFTNIGGQARNRIAALDTASALATAWNPNASSSVSALAVSGGTVYAGGFFTTIGGQTRNRIAALDGATGLATAWNPNASSTVSALAVSGGTVYAGGSFTTIGAQTRNRIAALDGTSGLATAWDPNANLTVSVLALSGGTVYAGGDFASIGGQTRNGIAAVDGTSGLATAWDPNASSSVRALAVSGGTVYAGGIFASIGGLPHSNLACLIVPQPVDVPTAELTPELDFAQPSPNPTSGEAQIQYTLPLPAYVRIHVFDLQGRMIARLVDEMRPAGRQRTTWSGAGSGRNASAGLYFVRFEAGGRRITKRLVLVR